VAKYEGNTPTNKKVMIQVQVCGGRRQRQRRRDYSNTYFSFEKKKVELKTTGALSLYNNNLLDIERKNQ
jgi:hypothetical protein